METLWRHPLGKLLITHAIRVACALIGHVLIHQTRHLPKIGLRPSSGMISLTLKTLMAAGDQTLRRRHSSVENDTVRINNLATVIICPEKIVDIGRAVARGLLLTGLTFITSLGASLQMHWQGAPCSALTSKLLENVMKTLSGNIC